MLLFKKTSKSFTNKFILKALCLVLLSSFTLNLYPFPGLQGLKKAYSSSKTFINTNMLHPIDKRIQKYYSKAKEGIIVAKTLIDEMLRDKRSAEQINYENTKNIEEKILGENNFTCNSIVTANEWKELEIEKIIEKWKIHTKTNFDMWGINYLLKNSPKGSSEILKTLSSSENAFKAVDEIMDKVYAAEEALISYCSRGNVTSMPGAIISTIKNLNLSGIKNYYKSAGITGILMEGTQYFTGDTSKNISTGLDLISEQSKSIKIKAKLYSIAYFYKKFLAPAVATFSLLGINKIISNCFNNKNHESIKTITFGNNKLKSALAWTVAAPLTAIKKLFSCKGALIALASSIYISYCQKSKCDKNRQYLIKIADLLKSLKQLQTTLSPEIASHIPALQNIKNYFDNEYSNNDIKRLFKLLESPTFKADNINYSIGEVLAANNLLEQTKDLLLPLLQNIALLGGYRAIAKMIKESKGSKAEFCFVKKIESNTPVIDLEKAWFPLINSDKVVPNDINLGGLKIGSNNKEAHNAVITGPNAGGKSITMMATGFNVLLSKLGIACAKSATITDFSRIVTALTPQQEVAKGLSCFQSEVKSIKNVEKEILSCTKNNKILAILDEPYKGTCSVIGANLIYNFGIKIAIESDNCAMIMATHMEKPTKLAQETDNKFKNYQVKISEDKRRMVFERTFEIEEGSSTWWFENTENKRSRYVEQLETESHSW